MNMRKKYFFMKLLVPMGLLLFVAVAFLFADEFTASVLFDKGIQEYNDKRYDNAEKLFLKAIEEDPQHAKSYFYLGDLYCINPNAINKANAYYTKTFDILSKKKALNKDEQTLMLTVQDRLSKLNKWTFALNTEKAKYIKSLITLAESALSDKEPDAALKIYDEIMIIDKNNEDAIKGKKIIGFFNNFDISIASNKYIEADAYIDQILLLDPKNETAKELKELNSDKVRRVKKEKELNEKQNKENIFNGNDIVGWKGISGQWSVNNRNIYCKMNNNVIGYLPYLDQEFKKSFTVEMEFKSTGEAGILLGGNDKSESFYSVTIYENKVVINYIVPSSSKIDTRKVRHSNVKDFLNKPNEYNVLKVQIINGSLNVFINDNKCIEGDLLSETYEGYVGCFSSGGEIWVRKLRVTEP